MDSRREPLQALAGVVAGPYGPGMDQARKLGLSEVEELYAYDGGQDSGVVDKVLFIHRGMEVDRVHRMVACTVLPGSMLSHTCRTP